MIAEKKKQMVPQLRFSEFDGEWERKKLGELAVVKRGAGSQYIDYINNSKDGIRLIRIGDFLGSEAVYVKKTNEIQRFLLNPNDILIAGTGATAGITFLIPEEFVGHAYSYNAPKITVIDSNEKFITFYLKCPIITRQQQRLFTGNAQPFLDTKSIRNFKISIPKLQEQQKIASFLTAVDKKIQQLTTKKEHLENYKKGVMQQLFSQQLRFKDEDGNDFPDWKSVRGNVLFDNISDKNHNSDLPILAITQDQGAVPRELINYQMVVTDKSVASYKVVQVGDFVISLRTFQGGIEYSNYHGICSPAYVILRPSSDNVNRDFYKAYLKTASYIKQLQKNLEGIRDGKMISYKYFSEIKLPFPSPEEQQKIAAYLGSLDAKIESVAGQIAKTEEFKKGLLQQLFV